MLSSSSPASELKKDEEIVFFPSLAQKVAKGAIWETEIHGWVYEPEQRSVALELFRKSLGVKREEVSDSENALFTERARAFMVDNERGKPISIRVGEKVHAVGKSEPNGHVSGRVRIPAEDLTSERVSFYAVLPAGDSRVFAGEIHRLDAAGLSVISDLDDTIKVSEVRDRKALLMNTFFRPFKPVDGMASIYQSWAKANGAKFHYVSASPWQLYPSLADFVLANDFPAGTFHLRPFRWKDETFFDLFKSPEKYKLSTIEPILKRFPGRRFVLIGDSGEKDPEIYATLARKFPKQVVRILIRDVTNEAAESDRYRLPFKGLPATLWSVFRDPKEVADAIPR